MISKFNNLFKRDDLEEQKAFQTRVINLLKKQYPTYKFEKSENPSILIYNENKLGLTNLYNKFLLGSQTNYELIELANEHFENVFSIDFDSLKQEKSWDEVRKLIFPQIMPIEYKGQFPVVNFPLGEEVLIGFVIDSEKAYQYVTKDNLKEWKIEVSELEKTALENLAEISHDIEMTFVPPPNTMFVINTMDGFDAVRILLPDLQDFIAEKLGKSFYFGISNRDFLICWSKNSDADFQTTVRNQIAVDFTERPYPLSKFTFEFQINGKIVQNSFQKSANEDKQNWISNN